MTSKAFQVWSGLPTWAKGVIAVGGVAIGYFAVSSFLKRVKSKAQLQKERETVAAAKKDLNSLSKEGIKPSYSDTQYKSWADQIESQFSGCDMSSPLLSLITGTQTTVFGNIDWSNSGKAMYGLLSKMKNTADLLKLVDAYGIRTYDQCGLWTGDYTGGLAGAVTDELSQDEIKYINRLLFDKQIAFNF